MISFQQANTTIQNNLLVTNNLMFAVRDLSPVTHIIKLGTMGEYGTPNIDIEEGWLQIEHKGRKGKFLFPRAAGSIYHTTKVMDTDLLWFGVRIWGLKVTDLMQGPVYGIETEESSIDTRLHTFLITMKFSARSSIVSSHRRSSAILLQFMEKEAKLEAT